MMRKLVGTFYFFFLTLQLRDTLTTPIFLLARAEPLNEDVRVAEYTKRGYSWPFDRYVPDTPGWRKLLSDRYQQVASIEDDGDRYMGYVSMAASAITAPNYTELGFGLARAPQDLVRDLRQGILDGLPSAREEHGIHLIMGEKRPLFIDRPDLTSRVLQEMQPYAEAWARIPLKAYTAYGFRLYRNNSQLMMHTDRSQTHVVSFILHIASSEGSEPWPLLIEDFDGRTHSVVLTPGDVLFYESSKCNHGRPVPFRGDWYTSVFVHYYPDDGAWESVDHDLEDNYSVPPTWGAAQPRNPKLPRMVMEGMSFREPDCPNGWCRSVDEGEGDLVEWSGPGVEGYWINPRQQMIPLVLGPAQGTTASTPRVFEDDKGKAEEISTGGHPNEGDHADGNDEEGNNEDYFYEEEEEEEEEEEDVEGEMDEEDEWENEL